jgi:hypothetical protein
VTVIMTVTVIMIVTVIVSDSTADSMIDFSHR